MKYKNILPLIVGSLLITSCADQLNTYPEGGTITQDQKDQIAEKDPDKLKADLQGMYSGFTSAWNTFGRSENIHFDYAYPAITLMLETSGEDMVSVSTGYNWFSEDLDFSSRIYTSFGTSMIWKRFYQGILAANSIIKGVDPETTTDKKLLGYLGEAKAMRAFCYFQLAQTLQFTYFGNQSKLCVPIITEETLGSNHPRKSVEDVYKFIMDDLDDAIGYLQDASSRSDKGHIDKYVASGIRARVNLVMHNYEDAVSDAKNALKGNATPYSISDVSVPAFNDATSSAWIWALLYTPESNAVKTGIINWPSHLCSMSKNSYTSQGVHRMINSNLWAKISDSDVRKGWWVDDELSSPLSDNLMMGDKSVAKANKFTPYTNVKFGAYKDDPNSSDNAQDWPMMRAEEMHLIIAEGMALGGNPSGAKEYLEEFIQEYRDPDYTCPATTAAELQEEIWFQRRIELWGEGFALYDILRLNKPVNRKDSNFDATLQFNIPAGSDILIFRIPRSEIEANLGISEEDNNPSAPLPEP